MAKKKRYPDCFTAGCTVQPIRSDRFDAYYCPTCLVWLERQCGFAECDYCGQRPEKPVVDQP